MDIANLTHNDLPQAVGLLLQRIDEMEQTMGTAVSNSDGFPEVMTMDEAASFLRMEKATLYAKTKNIKHSKPGKHNLFLKTDLIEYLKNNYVTTAEEQFQKREAKRKNLTTKPR